MSKTERRVESAKAQAVRQRNYRRARDRALARLGNDYPNVYRAYLEEEIEADENMGKKWLDIAGNTKSSSSGSR
jgi:predicted AAA+ superfamily ATPase